MRWVDSPQLAVSGRPVCDVGGPLYVVLGEVADDDVIQRLGCLHAIPTADGRLIGQGKKQKPPRQTAGPIDIARRRETHPAFEKEIFKRHRPAPHTLCHRRSRGNIWPSFRCWSCELACQKGDVRRRNELKLGLFETAFCRFLEIGLMGRKDFLTALRSNTCLLRFKFNRWLFCTSVTMKCTNWGKKQNEKQVSCRHRGERHPFSVRLKTGRRLPS